MAQADTDTERTRVATAALAGVGAWAAPAVLVGFGLPLRSGWGLPVALVVAAVALVTLRGKGSASATLARASAGQRLVLLTLTALPAVVLFTVGARAIGSLAIAYPAALWAVPVVVLGAAVTKLGRARLPVVLALGMLVPVAGVLGTRYEAGAEDARGWAQSGPIHGVHPGQTTAVIVDGYGPFDLPVNDYVEPAGDRGYSPETFAQLVEEALHRIATVHYADGPARARMAFAQAEATALTTPAVRERVDRDPGAQEHPRFIVRSGTFGQRSRVEFVCPGRRDDPRGHPGEAIMNRMCPTKYASEASAGLGVTGRWPGYAEGRGNERLGLSRWLGWTRSDDDGGRATFVKEQRRLAWLVALVLVALVVPARSRAGVGVAAVGGAVAVLALVAVVALALGADAAPMQVSWLERPRVPDGGYPLLGWLGVLLLVGGIPAFGADEATGDRQGRAWGIRLAGAAVAVTVLVLAANVSGLGFVEPVLYGEIDGELALQAFVAGAAEAIGSPFGLTVLEVEGAVAAAAAAALLGGLTHLLAAVGDGARRLATPGASGWSAGRLRVTAVIAVAAAACAMAMSRKTLGAATLVPGAVGLTAVLHSGLHLLQRGVRPVLAGIHVLLVVVTLVLIVYPAAHAGPHPFVSLCVVLGGLTALAGLVLPVLGRARGGA